MARLTAYGRTEVARLEKEQTYERDDLLTWDKHTVALMSDGTVLSKHDVRFRVDNRRHSYGWKKVQRLPTKDAPEVRRAAFVAFFAKRGFKEVVK